MVDLGEGGEDGDGDDLWLFGVAFSTAVVLLESVALDSLLAAVFSFEATDGVGDGLTFCETKKRKN